MTNETIRALEVRKNSMMAEKNKSAMQTLGANNPVCFFLCIIIVILNQSLHNYLHNVGAEQ